MCKLMVEADLAVGAAGSTSWERCCLGLPTVVLVLADNQEAGARALVDSGAAVHVQTCDEANLGALKSAIIDLEKSPTTLATLAAAAAKVVDGQGVRRSHARIIGLGLERATLEHARAIWRWRNDPVTRQASRDKAEITWEAHEAWFARGVQDGWQDGWQDGARLTYVATIGGEPCGVVRFDEITSVETPLRARLTSLNLNPLFRGQGLGGLILGEGCDRLRHTFHGPILAEIAVNNVPSHRIFTACGFTRISDADAAGFARYAYSH